MNQSRYASTIHQKEYSEKNINRLIEHQTVQKELLSAGKRRAEDMWNQTADVISQHVNKNGVILDVGVALGLTTEIFMNNLKGNFNNVYTTDVVPLLQVEGLKKRYSLMRGEHLPYSDNTMDTIFFVDVLHHAPNPQKLLMESQRVVKNKGIVIILENMLRDDLPVVLNTIYTKALFAFDNTSNAQSESSNPHSNQTLKNWNKIAKKSGLTLINHKEWQWGLIDFIPGMTQKGNRTKPSLLRPFTDSIMVFQK